MIIGNEEIDIGTFYAPYLKNLQSSECHTDITTYDFSERWGISLAQSTVTIKKTTHKFLRRPVPPLDRRYRMYIVFKIKTLQGQWLCGMLNSICKSIYGNHYYQVFSKNSYVSKVYPIYSKRKYGDALKLFYQDSGVPEKINFYSSKEDACKGTTFMKEVHRQGVDYHISESELHNQNPVEVFISEVGHKWYHTMVNKRVLGKIWEYGVSWVSELIPITNSLGGNINVGILLKI